MFTNWSSWKSRYAGGWLGSQTNLEALANWSSRISRYVGGSTCFQRNLQASANWSSGTSRYVAGWLSFQKNLKVSANWNNRTSQYVEGTVSFPKECGRIFKFEQPNNSICLRFFNPQKNLEASPICNIHLRIYVGGSLSSQKNIEASANGSTWTSQYVQVWLTSQRNLVTTSFLNSALSPSISRTAVDRIPRAKFPNAFHKKKLALTKIFSSCFSCPMDFGIFNRRVAAISNSCNCRGACNVHITNAGLAT